MQSRRGCNIPTCYKQFLKSDKIPDEVIIKNLLTENGKLNAYIQELEHKISVMYKPDKNQMREIKREKFYLAMRDRITKLNETINRLRKSEEKLIIKNLNNGRTKNE